MGSAGFVFGLTVWATCALAQYPGGQYPGGQYPGGQYPPNTYPGGGYPPNTYPGGGYPPNTYPGGGYPESRLPGGLPLPRLPKRGDKDKSKSEGEVKVNLAAVDGTLRKLGEKDLVLQAGAKKLLRFRLLPKTQFRNKDGEAMRDSLLHPGDQLSVQVSPDDEETAVRVNLVKPGSANERTAAELPFDAASVRAPRAEDLGKAKTVSMQKSSAGEVETPAAEAEEPSASSAAKSPGEAPAASTAGPTKPLGTDADVILEARLEAANFTAGLPNFAVQQLTTRYFGSGFPARWQKIDEVSADVAYVDGKEEYRNIAVNGNPVNQPPERSGSWSTGEFSTTMEDVLSLPTNARFKRRGDDRIGSRAAVVFDYTVAQTNSHWTLVSPDGRNYNPAYEGAIWIDKETRRVLRIEQRATGFPQDYPFSKAETILTYAFVRIDGKPYLLPEGSENLGCSRGSGTCSRNVIEFKNYKKFSAESTVNFGK
jgi:hypothetical protein